MTTPERGARAPIAGVVVLPLAPAARGVSPQLAAPAPPEAWVAREQRVVPAGAAGRAIVRPRSRTTAIRARATERSATTGTPNARAKTTPGTARRAAARFARRT